MKPGIASFLLVSSIVTVHAFYSVSVTEEEEQAPQPKEYHSSFDTENPPTSIKTPACAKGRYCYGEAVDFAQNCKSTDKGFVNGGRCFFRLDGGYDWTEAFDACKKLGAELAQIHTTAEFSALTAHFRSKGYPGAPWERIAMKRLDSITDPNAISLPYTWWYDTATTRHPTMSAGNTWVRNHARDDGFGGTSGNCIVVYGNHDQIGDELCTHKFPAICVRNNAEQVFGYTARMCLAEPALETHYDISVDDCGIKCSKIQWCRSFNYYPNGKCELFSFVMADTANKESRKGCHHYSYRA